ncbi:hypothetical protein SLNWT_6257 [Streptomyces albus]|uniref:Uncharacterized protein n=1 Tax=Streptomyces albus (strain ATCC 21838 / DSM 41398 / FERM P-419 / JCM 4703 / NBRC 107858) TaxID=1081613 RepID=A0A0B5EUV7_STRA4|nr:hypothetical protein SLNWT_6257 [Streptomyces albus]AOU80937.1 hypothetical protein SLNHY_6246 [Streptomyces albus]AYN36639.1 hypothetical protein DUI70_6146 [Streptomyces albus]
MYRSCCAVPDPAPRGSAVPSSLERHCPGGEIICVIASPRPAGIRRTRIRGEKQAAADAPPRGIRSRPVYYRY